jgi:predicted transcriptional regulator
MDNRKRKAQHRASRAAQKAVEDPSDTPKREMERVLFTEAGLKLAYVLGEGRFLSIHSLCRRAGIGESYACASFLPILQKEGWITYHKHLKNKEVLVTPKGMVMVKDLQTISKLLRE